MKEENQLEFDYSEFHDLEHSVWRCAWECWLGNNQYGGWQHHLWLRWTYHLSAAWRAETLCRLGKHSEPTPMWIGYTPKIEREEREPDAYVCCYCWKTLKEGNL